MLEKTEPFWQYTAKEIMGMKYEKIKGSIMAAASPASVEEIAVTVTKRREASQSPAEKLACSRILSALIDGPDVLEF